MEVEAIYRKGQLEFIEPLKLREEEVRVVVRIPDSAVSKSETANLEAEGPPLTEAQRNSADALLARFQTIRDTALNLAPSPATRRRELDERLAAAEARNGAACGARPPLLK